MDNNEIYQYILSKVQSDLSEYGYSRSGNSMLFYRYSADKRIACCIEMQKSMFNYSGSYSFTFNLLCVALYELNGYSKDRLTISIIKKCFPNPYVTKRIGMVCRKQDYWWSITDEILSEYGLAQYYDRFLHNDIINAAIYLENRAKDKEKIYQK